MSRLRLVLASTVVCLSATAVIGVNPSTAQSFSLGLGDLFPTSTFSSSGTGGTSGGWIPSGVNQNATSNGWPSSGINGTSAGWPTGSTNLGSLFDPLGNPSGSGSIFPFPSGGSSGGGLNIPGLGNIGSSLGGATSAGNLGGLGNLLGGLSSSGGSQVQQSLSPVVSFLQQLQGIQSQLQSVLQTVMGNISSSLGQAVKDTMGSLNIPDPGALLQAVLKNSGKDGNGTAKQNVSGISSVILDSNQSKEVQAKVFNATYLSKDAQDNIQKELLTALQLIQGSGQLVQSSAQLAQQAGKAVEQSGKGAETANTTAQGAQKRVSTQDAIKDLNTIAAVQSGQLVTLSGQLGTQSGQLSNITGLQGAQLQVMGNMAARNTQIAITSAVSAQQLMETTSHLRGQEQLRVMKGVADADRVNQLSQLGMSLMK